MGPVQLPLGASGFCYVVDGALSALQVQSIITHAEARGVAGQEEGGLIRTYTFENAEVRAQLLRSIEPFLPLQYHERYRFHALRPAMTVCQFGAKGSRAAQRAVGNAVCVALSKAIVLAAVAVQKGEASVPGEAVTAPAAPSPVPTKTKRAFELSYKQYRRLRRRVEALEKNRVPQSAH